VTLTLKVMFTSVSGNVDVSVRMNEVWLCILDAGSVVEAEITTTDHHETAAGVGTSGREDLH
jgi:hypothetical protein